MVGRPIESLKNYFANWQLFLKMLSGTLRDGGMDISAIDRMIQWTQSKTKKAKYKKSNTFYAIENCAIDIKSTNRSDKAARES